MKDFSVSPREMFASFWRNRELIQSLVIRDVVGRYKGSLIGLFWSFLNPLLMLATYTFVFSVVFKAQWPSEGATRSQFALTLFVGLMVFNFFSDCLQRSPGTLLQNVSYVTKVLFPLEILPLVIICSAFFHLIVSLFVWGIFYIICIGPPHSTLLYFPIIVLPMFFLVLGATYFFVSLGIYIRDISQFLGIALAALMFLSPIFYPVTALPESFQSYVALNPIAPEIEWMRGILLQGITPNWLHFGVYLLLTLLIAWIGFIWFQKTRSGFADVI